MHGTHNVKYNITLKQDTIALLKFVNSHENYRLTRLKLYCSNQLHGAQTFLRSQQFLR